MQPREGDRSSRLLFRRIKALVCLALISVGGASDSSAQIFKTIYSLSRSAPSDGGLPEVTGVVLAGNTVYGSTYYGGTNDDGVIFSVNADGTGFTLLHTFSAAFPPNYTNADGVGPKGSLTLAGDTLYGAAYNGGMFSDNYGSAGCGTIYSIKTNGNGFTLIHAFDSTNGINPQGPLVVAGGKIYGTTAGNQGTTAGIAGNHGTVFSINLDGSDHKVLHAFTDADGALPNGIVLSGDTLYGNTFSGGTNGYGGVVFSIKTNGENFTPLHTFSAATAGFFYINDEGMLPQMLPVVSGDTIYGSAEGGGSYGMGTLFSVKTNGSDFTVLHTFADVQPGAEHSFFFDGGGAGPCGITVSNGAVYGVAPSGGTNGSGVVYSINTDGSHFNVLHTFTAVDTNSYTNFEGASPYAALVLSGNTLYGAAEIGGQGGGTIFSLVIQPTIANLQLAGTNLVIDGFNGVAGENCVTLFSPDLASPVNWTPIATNLLPAGNFTIIVTNAVASSASNGFYVLQTHAE